MRVPIRTLPVLLILAGLAAGCGTSTSGPEQVLQSFYDHLDRGNYTEAMAMYTPSMVEMFEDPANDFATWARAETHDGTVAGVKVVSEEATDAGTVLRYEVTFADGESTSRSVTLTEEDGQWKLGMVE